MAHCDRVMLVANPELREAMWVHMQQPEGLSDAAKWKELVEAMGEDARRSKDAD